MKTKIIVGLVLITSLLSFTTFGDYTGYMPSESTPGCTDPAATNYDASATEDDGSCYYDEYGCMDSTAENYNPSATQDDGSCYYAEYGCTDPQAKNFNANATVDDGSCDYATCGDGTCDLTSERCSCPADCGDGGGVCKEKPPVTYKYC